MQNKKGISCTWWEEKNNLPLIVDTLFSYKAGPSCAPYTEHQACYVDILNAMVTSYSIEELINSDHAKQ